MKAKNYSKTTSYEKAKNRGDCPLAHHYPKKVVPCKKSYIEINSHYRKRPKMPLLSAVIFLLSQRPGNVFSCEVVMKESDVEISYSLFNGSQYEGRAMLPMDEDFVQRFNLDDFVVVADSGLMNKTNVSLLESGGYNYILGQG